MSYATIYDVASDPTSALRKQVAVAVIMAATAVRYEAPTTPNHVRRVAWADRVLADGPAVWAERMIWRVLEAPVLRQAPASAEDSDVQNIVNSLIDFYAGA